MNEYLVYCYRIQLGNPRHWHPLAIIEAKDKDEAIKLAYYYHEVTAKEFLKAVPTSCARPRDIDAVYVASLRRSKKHPQIIASVEL